MTSRVKKDWQLRLYIADESGLSRVALQSLKEACEKYVQGHYQIEVVDIEKQPERANDDDIIAIPTLVRLEPGPKRRVVGATDVESLAVALGFPPLRAIGTRERESA